MNRKAALQLSVNFLVIMIIAIVVFTSSIYLVKKFFTQAETIKMTYDERTEKEIERLLDDGSRIAIPFDKKIIGNREFKTFGIGVLNTLSPNFQDRFRVNISFNKAYNKDNEELCSTFWENTYKCGYPGTWLQTAENIGDEYGLVTEKTIKNNEQQKFLLGVSVKDAPKGTYIFDVMVCVEDRPAITNSIKCPSTHPDPYDSLHKLYVEVP